MRAYSRIFWCSIVVSVCAICWMRIQNTYGGLARERLINAQGTVQLALFVPGDDIQRVLLDLIEHETDRIRIAVYIITDRVIADALIAAHKRGVRVEVVSCSSRAYLRASKITCLLAQGIAVYLCPAARYAVMHHKFFIFNTALGFPVCATGSFNCTNSAAYRNKEDIIFLSDPAIVTAYEQRFSYLIALSKGSCYTKSEKHFLLKSP